MFLLEILGDILLAMNFKNPYAALAVVILMIIITAIIIFI